MREMFQTGDDSIFAPVAAQTAATAFWLYNNFLNLQEVFISSKKFPRCKD